MAPLSSPDDSEVDDEKQLLGNEEPDRTDTALQSHFVFGDTLYLGEYVVD